MVIIFTEQSIFLSVFLIALSMYLDLLYIPIKKHAKKTFPSTTVTFFIEIINNMKYFIVAIYLLFYYQLVVNIIYFILPIATFVTYKPTYGNTIFVNSSHY